MVDKTGPFSIKKITNPFQKVYFLRSMFEEKLNLLLLDQTHLEYFIGANIQTHWEVSGKNKAFSTSKVSRYPWNT